MHFTYTYIEHEVDKLQRYLDFLFFEVWCKADGEFDADKLDACPELKQIYIDLGNIDIDAKGGKSAFFFNSHIEKIYEAFLYLDEDIIERLKEGYANNNNVEGLCCDKAIQPLLYKEIEAENKDLAQLLKGFYGKLYGSNSPFNLKVFGQLKDKLLPNHNEKFMDANGSQVCPFCGLLHLKGNNHSYREAYDHYLPKAIYPFNPINFKNLAPMCNECNSTYKTTKIPIKKCNPLADEEARQLAFYPYADQSPEINFSVHLNSLDIANLNPDDIEVEITSEGNEEQVASWKRVFGLVERYKAVLCHPNEGRYWVSFLLDELENARALQPGILDDYLYNAKLREAKKNPLSNYGFIKAPFLSACKERGVFESHP